MILKLPQQLNEFNFRVKQLQDYEGPVRLDKIRKKRTIQQNKYVHVLFAKFGIETGYTIEEAKTLAKRKCDFMRYAKNGEVFLKKTSELNTKELTDFIEWFRNYAAQAGIFLPSPDDYLRNWEELEREIDNHKQYL